jgi:hypothetical protein
LVDDIPSLPPRKRPENDDAKLLQMRKTRKDMKTQNLFMGAIAVIIAKPAVTH